MRRLHGVCLSVHRETDRAFGDIWCLFVSFGPAPHIYQRGERVGGAVCTIHGHYPEYLAVGPAGQRGLLVKDFGDIWCQFVSFGPAPHIYQRGERVGGPVCTIHGHCPESTWSSVRFRTLFSTSPYCFGPGDGA